MSYQLLGLGAVLRSSVVVPAEAPAWPWGSITCPLEGQSLRSAPGPDGQTGYYCLQPGVVAPAEVLPGDMLLADKYGRAGFWTITNTILVAVGLSVALSIGASVAGSLVVTKAKQRREDRAEAAS